MTAVGLCHPTLCIFPILFVASGPDHGIQSHYGRLPSSVDATHVTAVRRIPATPHLGHLPSSVDETHSSHYISG